MNANISSAINVRLLYSAYVFNFHSRILLCCSSKLELTLLSNTEYLDKTLVNYANVMGLQEDAGINGKWLQTDTYDDNGYIKLMPALPPQAINSVSWP